MKKEERDLWNRCDVCGRFIPMEHFNKGGPAVRDMITPDAEGFSETWETLCEKHADLARN